ncbi:MAG: parallel beta-helix domain-containing protein [Pseudomonadota bacterium]
MGIDNRIIRGLAVTLIVGAFGGCGETPSSSAPDPAPSENLSAEQQLMNAFAAAQPGSVIEIPAGVHEIRRSLVLDVDDVTIRGTGAGRGERDSVLTFKNQVAGAEGMLLSGDNLVLEGFAIEDTRGDALKINDSKNVIIRAVRTEWTNGPDVDNGAYGIYPVQVENLLLEECVAIGASDAGIYVGQSKNVVVRNNLARDNVAGIEIENTIDADVYENLTESNTGGILVFNMPDIPQTGERTRVFNNDVRDNNTANFAAPGTAVSGVPAGSGIMVNSNDLVEIFDNRISGHNTANIVLSSYYSANYAGQRELAPGFDPYPEGLNIYSNTFGAGGNQPDRPELEAIRVALFGAQGSLPDLIWDGAINPSHNGSLPSDRGICVDNGDAVLLDVDLLNAGANPNVDMSRYQCELPKLSAVTLPHAT